MTKAHTTLKTPELTGKTVGVHSTCSEVILTAICSVSEEFGRVCATYVAHDGAVDRSWVSYDASPAVIAVSRAVLD